MAQKKTHRQPQAERKEANETPPTATPKKNASRDSGRPGGGQGRSDRTGVIRGEVRVDPYFTEGHPGYDESGPSEIIPQERLTGKGR
jgi:hypothetical protein